MANAPVVDSGIASRTVAVTPLDEGLYLALAPMDGVTDWVYRDLLTSLQPGAISLCVSEFVRVTSEAVPAKVIRRHCPEVDQGGRTAAGVPVQVQLLGGQPKPMAETAARAVQMGAYGIDINFGCPAKTVNRHDGGAALLKDPARMRAIVAAVRDAVPHGRPVSAKIRTGWDSDEHIEQLAEASELGGADWLTVHGRTRRDGYGPKARWATIGRARAATRFPVVANGDLRTPQDVVACQGQSGCRAFMIGRGSMGRPVLFAALRGASPAGAEGSLSEAQHIELLHDYVGRMLRSGTPPRSALGHLKHWLRLGGQCYPPLQDLFERVKRVRELPQALALLDGLGSAAQRAPLLATAFN